MAGKAERVVVTGMGLASPLGCNLSDFWQALLAGRSGVVNIEEKGYSGFRTHIGALVDGYDPEEHFNRKEARRMSRSTQLALVAAKQAITQAQLIEKDVNLQDVAVMVGSSIGGYSAADTFFRDFYITEQMGPFTIPISMNAGPSSNISIKYGFQGPLVNLDAACATSAYSIGYAYNLIRSGSINVAVSGGADCPFSRGVVAAWWALRALSSREDNPAEACRPFSADRDGLVLGEGAGVLVLESESHARSRGVPILAEILGHGASADGYHLTQPSQDGPVRAMQLALEDAECNPEEIDYINAHGTGTEWNDKNETAAIKQVFGSHAYEIPVVGNKAALGHSIGASGALELISCILSINGQIVSPTINYKEPDPDCDLDYVVEGSRSCAINKVMSNSFAFGGSNAVLVVGAY